MKDRQRILTTAMLAMVSLTVVVTTAALFVTYRNSLIQKRVDLQTLAVRESRLIEAVAEFDAIHSKNDDPEGARGATLSQIASAQKRLATSDPTHEVVIAYRDSDDMVFFFQKNEAGEQLRVPWASQLSEPMRRALLGHSGTIQASDYAGTQVMAAYEPIPSLRLGLVAKIDMARLRSPFISAIRDCSLLAVVAIGLGLLVLRRRLDPLIQRSQDSETQALTALAELSGQKHAMDEHSIVATTDPSGTITYVNQKFCDISQYSREELIGQNHRIVNSGHYPRSFWTDVWKTIAAGETWHDEVRNRAKDGSLYWVDTTIVPFKDETGKITQYIAIRTDITERKQAEEELHKLSVAVEQSPSIIIITDVSGTIEYVNPKFTHVTGYTKEEAVGQNPRVLKSGKWPETFYKEMWETILAGKTWRGEFENKKKNGELYWSSASISPVRSPNGEITHFLAVEEDISVRKLKDDELQQAKIAAEVANQAKSDFLANMSHEIRTPMTAILGFAENLLDTDQSESERLDCVNTIRQNGECLLGIINDILDLSKVEAHKINVEHVACKPCQIIADVASLVRVRASVKELAFHVEYLGAIPETIESDPTRLRQILINLIDNAIKFTEEGAVRLIVRYVAEETGDGETAPKAACLQFDVLDTGVGMSDGQTTMLFKPFTQADTSTTRKFGGTGLGLTISKRFAELLGGDVNLVDSEVGVGTRFRATVATGSLNGVRMLDNPMAATVVDDNQTKVARPTRTDLQGLRILLAEDGPDNQRLISFVLKKAGAAVTVVENGKLALDSALTAQDSSTPFDLILMDMQMPVMDGYDATGQLRQQDYTGPIIALTAHAMDGDREKCISAGCDNYTTKPIDRQKLIELILKYVQNEPTTNGGTRAGTPKRAALEGCRILLAEDNATNRALVTGVLKKAGAEVTAVKDGKLAFDAALAAHNDGQPFDTILMDIQMPVMGGGEATTRLRESGYTRTIIALTANDLDGNRQHYADIGFDDCTSKPVNRTKLIEMILAHLKPGASDSPPIGPPKLTTC